MKVVNGAKCEVRSAGWREAGLWIPAPRTSHFALLVLLVAHWPAGPLAAQGVPPAVDSSAAADSARQDSLRQDATARFLSGAERAKRGVPILPDLGAEGPRALGSRIVLDRNAIAWRTAETVSDLLTEIPGVYIWRGGWFGRPVYANYRGRGAASVDWFVDGVPFAPLGRDSTGVDPGLFSLSLFERVEIERWPSGLRVYLYTPHHRSLAPRSRVGVTTGEFKVSRFQGDLEYRWPSGIGLTTAAEVFDAPTATGSQSSDAHLTSGLMRLEFVPRADRGIQVQLYEQIPDIRYYLGETGDTLGDLLRGTRTEAQVRLFLRHGDEARNIQADLLYARSAWRPKTDTIAAHDWEGASSIGGGGLILAVRQPRWRVAGTGWSRTGPTPHSLRLEGGYVPIDRFSVDAELQHDDHTGSRTSRWAGVRAGLQLPLGLSLEGAARQGSRVLAPSLANDSAQDISETSLRGSWALPHLTLSGGVSSTAGVQPTTFAPYLAIDTLRAFGRTRWLDLGATLRPLPWMTLDAWYSDPKGTAPQGLPPTHSLVRGEIHSKFLRKYPSGIFELRLAGDMETWGHGIIGTDGSGAPVPLRGATYYRMSVGFKLGGFQLYWDRVNIRDTKHGYVPGFRLPGLGQTYGMRWEFTN